MSDTACQQVEEVFRSAYLPGKPLRQILEDLVLASSELSELAGMSICIRPDPMWQAPRVGAAPVVVSGGAEKQAVKNCCRRCPLVAQSRPSESAGSASPLPVLPCNPGLATPVRYRRHTHGFVMRGNARSAALRKLLPIYEGIAARLACLLQRRELSRSAHGRFGRDLWLLGTSHVLTRVEQFLERAAVVSLPVLIRGERGSGREEIARALHLLSDRRHRPFTKLDASGSRSQDLFKDLRHRAGISEGGTLFLAAVDEMDVSLQSELADLLRCGTWAPAKAGNGGTEVRAVASASPPDTAEPGGDDPLHPALREELGFLEIAIDPLRARPEDIRHLVYFFLEHYGEGTVTEVDCGVLKAFETYAWPGNIPELRQVVGRLAAFARGRSIELEDLRSHAPRLIGRGPERKPLAAASLPAPAVAPPSSLAREALQICAAGRSTARLVDMGRLHPALGRAIDHLAEHATRKITVAELARHAYVSPSHLFHLFRQMLDMSVVRFLNAVRIERAKAMLVENSNATITEISWQVGFGDLRHFERVFRSLIGSAPTAFRRRFRRA